MKTKIWMFAVVGILLVSLFVLKYMYDIHEKSAAVMTVKGESTQKPSPQYTPAPSATPVASATPDGPLKIVAVGDILLGRGVGSRLQKNKESYIYPFEKVADLLKRGDVIFGNLEEPITASTHGLTPINQGGKYVLKNEAEAFDGIKYAGFNLLNLANNHILDYYDKGLYDTLEVLDKNGIVHAGAGKDLEEARKPAFIEKKGKKIAMISYTDMSEVLYKGNPPLMFIAGKDKAGVAPRKAEYIKEDLAKLKGKADIIIVSLHWGKEESFDVLPEQRKLAHELLDQGADIVLGHHPHQFQGMEIYKGKPIVYSMGNFIFDQNDPENQETFILNMEYAGSRLTSFDAIPMRTIEKTQVVPQEGAGAADMLKREAELCGQLETTCRIQNDKLVFSLNK